MSANHTDVDQWNTVVEASDGDAVAQAAWRDADGPLADRTYYLRQRTMGAGAADFFRVDLTPITATNFTFDTPDMNWRQNNVGSAGAFICSIMLPKRGTLVDLVANVKAAAGHGALPATMPRLTLYRKTLASTAATQLAQVSDTSASVAAYEAGHTIAITGQAEAFLHTGYRYYLTFEGETGANSAINFLLYDIYAAITA